MSVFPLQFWNIPLNHRTNELTMRILKVIPPSSFIKRRAVSIPQTTETIWKYSRKYGWEHFLSMLSAQLISNLKLVLASNHLMLIDIPFLFPESNQ